MNRRNRGGGAGGHGPGLFEGLEARVLMVFNPTASEQYMLELLNHMRMHPAENLALMTSSLGDPAHSANSDIDHALTQFGVKGSVLSQQWATLSAVPPLAWNPNLYQAAEAHTLKMIQVDMQTHQAAGEPDLGARVTNAGYNYSTAGENIYAFATGVFYGHAGFAIDWGNTPSGIQDPPGHRGNMMNASFREVGIRILSESDTHTSVGPLVITQDFGNRFGFGNPFLLGVAYDDSNNDRFYSPGEGLGGVTVTAVGPGGTFTATSLDAGGYQLQAPAGIYNVTFSGGAFGSGTTYPNVVIGSTNVKLDAERHTPPPTPNIAVSGNGVAIASGDTTPAAADWTDFGTVNLAQSLTRTFTVRNAGTALLRLTGSPHVKVNGSSSFILVQDASTQLDPQGTSTFTVLFDPSAAGVQTATITITSDDPDTASYTFRVRGRGQDAPDLLVLGGAHATPVLDGDTTPAFADGTGYSSVNIVREVKGRLFTITNRGSRPLTLPAGAVTLTGSAAGDFAVIQQPATVVNPGQSTSFRVRFNPSVEGARDAVVHIASDDPDAASYDFAVRGIGILAPIIEVAGMGVVIPPGAAPASGNGTDLGSTAADGGAVIRLFTVRNVGSAPLTLNPTKRLRVRVTGAGAPAYTVTLQPASATLGIGATATFRVRFDPMAPGLKDARIVIDAANAADFTFAITGVGV